MVLVYLKSGDCVELPNAVRAEHDDSRLVCFDGSGCELASFDVSEVEAFTNDPELVEKLEEEVCDDLTVLQE